MGGGDRGGDEPRRMSRERNPARPADPGGPTPAWMLLTNRRIAYRIPGDGFGPTYCIPGMISALKPLTLEPSILWPATPTRISARELPTFQGGNRLAGQRIGLQPAGSSLGLLGSLFDLLGRNQRNSHSPRHFLPPVDRRSLPAGYAFDLLGRPIRPSGQERTTSGQERTTLWADLFDLLGRNVRPSGQEFFRNSLWTKAFSWGNR